ALDNRFGVVARNEEVDIADGFAPPPERPREFAFGDRFRFFDVLPEILANWSSVAEQRALARLSGELDTRTDVVLGFRTEPLDFPYAFFSCGLGEVVEILDIEFVIEGAYGFRADTLDARERRHVDREIRTECF